VPQVPSTGPWDIWSESIPSHPIYLRSILILSTQLFWQLKLHNLSYGCVPEFGVSKISQQTEVLIWFSYVNMLRRVTNKHICGYTVRLTGIRGRHAAILAAGDAKEIRAAVITSDRLPTNTLRSSLVLYIGRGGVEPNLCSGYIRFEFRLWYRPSYLRFFVNALVPKTKIPGQWMTRLGRDRFLLNPFQFINHPTIRIPTVYMTESLNNPQQNLVHSEARDPEVLSGHWRARPVLSEFETHGHKLISPAKSVAFRNLFGKFTQLFCQWSPLSTNGGDISYFEVCLI
jgi:hypothetical protein